MRQMLGRVGVVSLLLLGLTVGCHKSMVQPKPPPDPLLISKKPIEGKPDIAEPTNAPRIDPLPPPPPPYDPPSAPDQTSPLNPRTVNFNPKG